MDFCDKLKTQRKKTGKTLEEIANSVGVAKATVQRWESGEIKNLRRDKISKLAEALETTPAFLMGWEKTSQPDIYEKYAEPIITPNTVKIPVLGSIAAGYDQIALEEWSSETIEIPLNYLKGQKKSKFFFLTVKGDSMYPAYMDGDSVLILKQPSLNRSGDIGAILYDSEYATLKKVEYVQGENWLKLIPLNPQFPPTTIEGVDLERCKVLGVPVLLFREI